MPEKSHNEMYDTSREGSTRKKIRHLLDKNPLLTASPLCKILGLDYKEHGAYVTNEKYLWKKSYKNRLGLKGLTGSNFKNWRGWIYVDKLLNRKKDPDVTRRAVEVGWTQTKAKNRYLLWMDPKLGRLEWHENGRVKIWIKKPADRGKVNELLVNAFLRTGLIFDLRIFTKFLNAVRFKGATLIIPTSQRLPYLKLDFLKESNGVIIKAGDRSHPHCYEINFFYPNWGEHSEGVVARFHNLLEKVFTPKPRDAKKDRGMVV